MKHIRRMIALLMCLLLMPVMAVAESQKLPLQAAHRVTYAMYSREQARTTAYWWQVKTAQDSVSRELNDLASGYVEEILASIEMPKYKDESRLDVNILNSRTGLTWMSFMVQARYVHNKVNKDVRFTTRTYDMQNGQRLMLTDIFPADSQAWAMLESAVREGVNAYYPDVAPDAAALDAACSREAIGQMDFTLRGMSLVLHLHAADFYPGKQQLIQVVLYYPEIRPHMTEKAQAETDNLAYYDTVALTYDDGPNGWVTRAMLETLMKTGTHATFFVVGNRVRGHAQYLQREHDEGHAIATHNFQHVYASQVSPRELRSMPEKVNRAHIEIIGIAPTYARAPGGIWKPMADAGMGWPLIQWTAEARDWEGDGGRDPYVVHSQMVGMASDGGILLMHDMQRNSVLSSEMFIPTLQERGYLFLTVDELFAKDGVVLQPDTAYWRCQNGVTTDE